MQVLNKVSRKSSAMAAPLLLTGDQMRQPEFHRRYEECADDIRFELVGGIVYMASPLSLPHSDYDEELGFAFGLYRRATTGIEVLRGVSIILGEFSEPQPDLGLRISPEHGGQSRTTANKKYVLGAPELLGEIAFSSRAIDMNQKRLDYRSAGVAEYLVLCVEEQELHWFDFRGRRTIRPTADGTYRSRVLPGLWINGLALLRATPRKLKRCSARGWQPRNTRHLRSGSRGECHGLVLWSLRWSLLEEPALAKLLRSQQRPQLHHPHLSRRRRHHANRQVQPQCAAFENHRLHGEILEVGFVHCHMQIGG